MILVESLRELRKHADERGVLSALQLESAPFSWFLPSVSFHSQPLNG